MKDAPGHTERENDETLDTTIGALASSSRRHILRRLSREPDNTATIDELGDVLLTDGNGRTSGDEAKIALLHAHLPKLTEAGIVDVDWRHGTVRYREDHLIESLLGQVTADVEP